MKRILLLSLLVVVSCASKNDAQNQIFKVHTFTVSEGVSSRTVSFPGRVKASEEMSLAFKVSGKIQSIYVKEGSYVKKGTLLAEIDPKDYKTLLEAADAKFAQVSAEAGRVIRLFNDSVVSANDYDKARYGLQQAEATLEYARRQVDECKMYAPADGYIQKRFFEPASIVGAGLPVIKMLSAGVPKIEIEIPASVYMGVSKFKSCTAKFANNVIEPLQLQIDNIQPKANANQLYTMTFSITSNTSVMPKPGMVAMVDVLYGVSDGSEQDTSVPVGAVFDKEGNATVWTIDASGCVHAMTVTVKMLDADGMAVIEQQLEPGTEIVTAGVHKLHEGDKVEKLERPSETNIGGIL